MSTQRPKWFPLYGDPVRCPIKERACARFDCVMGGGAVCEERNALALVPIEPPKDETHC